MSVVKLPPYLHSEVSTKLRAVDPVIATILDLPETSLSGEELEALLCAIWLMGYGEGAAEGTKGEIGQYLLGKMP